MHFKIQKTAESRNIPQGSWFMKGIPFIFEIRMDQRTLVGVSESYVQGRGILELSYVSTV